MFSKENKENSSASLCCFMLYVSQLISNKTNDDATATDLDKKSISEVPLKLLHISEIEDVNWFLGCFFLFVKGPFINDVTQNMVLFRKPLPHMSGSVHKICHT